MDRYIPQIESALTRFREWKGSDETVVFPYVTDLHSHLTDFETRDSQKRETISHILVMNEAAKRFEADFTANLGDCGIDVPLKGEQESNELTEKLIEYHDACSNKPVLFAIGNHDIRYNLTPEFWGKTFRKINRNFSIVAPTDGSYGYYDIPAKKTRAFFLFCNETSERHSDSQVKWLEENLKNMPQDWCAVIMHHICMIQKGHWRARTMNPPHPQFVKINNMLSDFVRNGGRIAGVFSGDSHFNLNEKVNGVFYFSSQGYGGTGPSEAPDHALRALDFCDALGRDDSFDSAMYCLIDLVAIKYKKRETAIFRIGAGDKEFDVKTNY